MAKNETFTAARTYDHKAYGRMGVATFAVTGDNVKFTLNGTEIPAASVDHLMTFALQTLQDAYAGAEDATDAQQRFDGKLKRILEGTLGTRSGSGGTDPITAAIRSLIRNDVKAAIGDGWKAMDDDARDAAIDSVFADQPDEVQAALTDAAKGEIARKAAEKAARAALGAKLTIKLA